MLTTDSVMVEMIVPRDVWRAEVPQRVDQLGPIKLHSTPGISAAYVLGQLLEDGLNRALARDLNTEFLVLEFEQLFDVSVFLSPKRYCGSRWVNARMSTGVYYKGIQATRRDSSAPLREAMQGAISALLYSDDPDPTQRVQGAVHAVQMVMQRFVNNDIPFREYVMSKSLRAHYRIPNAKGPHLTVVRDLKREAPGSEPKPGNRVPFVICYDGCRGSKVAQKACDPDWALEHERRPDRTYYAESVITAMGKMLDDLLPGGRKIFTLGAPYLARIAAQDSDAVSLRRPPPIPLVELVAASPQKRMKQTSLAFTPLARTQAMRAPQPPLPPKKKRRTEPHPKLTFSKKKVKHGVEESNYNGD
jgi:hypothetical protein